MLGVEGEWLLADIVLLIVLLVLALSGASVISSVLPDTLSHCKEPEESRCSQQGKYSLLGGTRRLPPLTLEASLGRAATAATPPATTTLVDTIAGVPPGQQQTSILQYMRTSSRYSEFFFNQKGR